MGNNLSSSNQSIQKFIRRPSWLEGNSYTILPAISLLSFALMNLYEGRGIFSLFPTDTDSKEQLDYFEKMVMG